MTGYGWVDSLEAYCFTVIHGPDADEVLHRLGGTTSGGQPRTFEECFWDAAGPQWVQLARIGDRVLMAENNGWRGSEDETALELSKGGWLASVFCNVSAVMRFVYAVDGDLRAAFDPLLDKQPSQGSDPRCLDRPLGGLTFDLSSVASSAMLLLERLTGVAVTPAWLGRAQPAYPLEPLRWPVAGTP
jgi:hypothetical protein